METAGSDEGLRRPPGGKCISAREGKKVEHKKEVPAMIPDAKLSWEQVQDREKDKNHSETRRGGAHLCRISSLRTAWAT